MTTFCTVYHCQECGSPDLEISAWINVNSSEVMSAGTEGPSSDTWCPVCQDHYGRWEDLDVPISQRLLAIERARRWSEAYRAIGA